MSKKEVILTVAKDIMIAYKLMPEGKDRSMPEDTVKALGDLLTFMAKQVEKTYNEILG